MIRTGIALLIAGCAAALLAGCGRPAGSDSRLHLRVWQMWTGDEEKVFRSILDRYEREHPGIKIDSVSTNYDDGKTVRAIVAGAPPDFCTIADPRLVGQLAASGAALPLDDLFAKAGFRREQFTPGSIGQCLYKGKLYAMPYGVDCIALLWNKDAFREAGLDPDRPPRTLEELQSYAVRLTKRDKDGNLLRLGCSVPRYYLLISIFGGRLYDPERDAITADDPRNVEALTWYKQFVDAQGGLAKVNRFAEGFGQGQSANNPFFVGKVAMLVSGQWNPYWAYKYAPSLHYDAAPFPGLGSSGSMGVWGYGGMGVPGQPTSHTPTPAHPHSSTPPYSHTPIPPHSHTPPAPHAWLGGNFFIIPKGSKHPREAWDFLAWMESDEAQFLFADTLHGVPNTFSALRDRRLRQGESWRPAFGRFLDIAGSRNAAYFPVLPITGFFDNQMANATESIGYGRKTPQQALRDVQQRVAQEYAKWR